MLKTTFTLLFFFLLQGTATATEINSEELKRILILHSYHSGYKWSDDITRAIIEKVNEEQQLDVRVEYLDSKRYSSAEHLVLEKEYLERKYTHTSFDTIVAVDNSALLFLSSFRNELFPSIPVVFCGINSFSERMLKNQSNITGVAEEVDIEKNIDLMLLQQQNTTRIVVINDHTITGILLNQETARIAQKYPKITWSFPEKKSFAEIQHIVSTLEKGDLVLLGVYFRDKTNRSIAYDEAAKAISEKSAVPVFGLWDFYFGFGIVGGYLTSGSSQGTKAAEILLQILSGKNADEIPVISKSPNEYFADANVLRRFGLSESQFPSSTLFINKKPDLFSKYRKEILGALLLFIALGILSSFLLIAIFKKKKAEKELLQFTSELEYRVEERTAELSQATEEILERQQQMQHLLSNLNGMVYRCHYDSDWTMIFLSEGVTQLTGYSRDELLHNKTSSYAAIIDKRDQNKVNIAVTEAIEKRGHFTVEYRITTKDGDTKWVWEQGLAVYGTDKQVLYLEGFVTDISDRKEYEQQQAKLATAVQQTDDIIIITDLEGTIEYVNPAFVAVTGYSVEEAVNNNLRIIKSDMHSPEFYADMWKNLLRGNVWRGRIINSRKDDSNYIADTTTTPIRDQQGELSHFVIVQRDVSTEIALEKNLRQAQKLEALGTLAGGIAHEINTPAQFVGNNLEFIIESLPDLQGFITACYDSCRATGDSQKSNKEAIQQLYDDNDIEYLLEEIPLALQQSKEGISRVSEIVRSMKQFAHPGEESKSPCDINDAVRNTATVCVNEWKYVADLSFSLDENLPIVHCHQSEVNQVFLNLIVNAAHAIEKRYGPEKKGNITISTLVKDNHIEIRVSDDGSGIPEEFQSKIFDPFFTTKDVGKGTGQGLSIAHSVITEKHDGKLYFETEPEKGTTFIIELPVT